MTQRFGGRCPEGTGAFRVSATRSFRSSQTVIVGKSGKTKAQPSCIRSDGDSKKGSLDWTLTKDRRMIDASTTYKSAF